MARASRDTEILSSEVRTQSSMPLQPFMGKVKSELVVVGRFWMLSTGVGGKREKFVSAERWQNARDILLPCHVICRRRDPV